MIPVFHTMGHEKPFLVKNAAWLRQDLQAAKSALRVNILAMREARQKNLRRGQLFWSHANLCMAIRKNIKKIQRRLNSRINGVRIINQEEVK
jgi:hypothetical protein